MVFVANVLFIAFVLALANFQGQSGLKIGQAAFLFVAFGLNLFPAVAVWWQDTANPFGAMQISMASFGGYSVLIPLGMIGLGPWYIIILLSVRSNVTRLLRDEQLNR